MPEGMGEWLRVRQPGRASGFPSRCHFLSQTGCRSGKVRFSHGKGFPGASVDGAPHRPGSLPSQWAQGKGTAVGGRGQKPGL